MSIRKSDISYMLPLFNQGIKKHTDVELEEITTTAIEIIQETAGAGGQPSTSQLNPSQQSTIASKLRKVCTTENIVSVAFATLTAVVVGGIIYVVAFADKEDASKVIGYRGDA